VSPVWESVLAPDCGEEFQILDLAKHIARRCGAGRDTAIEFTGLRPGDKLGEELWSSDEILEAVLPSGLRVLKSPVPSARALAIAMQRLESAVENFDHEGMIGAVAQLVSGYGTPLAKADTPFQKIRDTADPSLPAVAQDDNVCAGPVAE